MILQLALIVSLFAQDRPNLKDLVKIDFYLLLLRTLHHRPLDRSRTSLGYLSPSVDNNFRMCCKLYSTHFALLTQCLEPAIRGSFSRAKTGHLTLKMTPQSPRRCRLWSFR